MTIFPDYNSFSSDFLLKEQQLTNQSSYEDIKSFIIKYLAQIGFESVSVETSNAKIINALKKWDSEIQKTESTCIVEYFSYKATVNSNITTIESFDDVIDYPIAVVGICYDKKSNTGWFSFYDERYLFDTNNVKVGKDTSNRFKSYQVYFLDRGELSGMYLSYGIYTAAISLSTFYFEKYAKQLKLENPSFEDPAFPLPEIADMSKTIDKLNAGDLKSLIGGDAVSFGEYLKMTSKNKGSDLDKNYIKDLYQGFKYLNTKYYQVYLYEHMYMLNILLYNDSIKSIQYSSSQYNFLNKNYSHVKRLLMIAYTPESRTGYNNLSLSDKIQYSYKLPIIQFSTREYKNSYSESQTKEILNMLMKLQLLRDSSLKVVGRQQFKEDPKSLIYFFGNQSSKNLEGDDYKDPEALEENVLFTMQPFFYELDSTKGELEEYLQMSLKQEKQISKKNESIQYDYELYFLSEKLKHNYKIINEQQYSNEFEDANSRRKSPNTSNTPNSTNSQKSVQTQNNSNTTTGSNLTPEQSLKIQQHENVAKSATDSFNNSVKTIRNNAKNSSAPIVTVDKTNYDKAALDLAIEKYTAGLRYFAFEQLPVLISKYIIFKRAYAPLMEAGILGTKRTAHLQAAATAGRRARAVAVEGNAAQALFNNEAFAKYVNKNNGTFSNFINQIKTGMGATFNDIKNIKNDIIDPFRKNTQILSEVRIAGGAVADEQVAKALAKDPDAFRLANSLRERAGMAKISFKKAAERVASSAASSALKSQKIPANQNTARKYVTKETVRVNIPTQNGNITMRASDVLNVDWSKVAKGEIPPGFVEKNGLIVPASSTDDAAKVVSSIGSTANASEETIENIVKQGTRATSTGANAASVGPIKKFFNAIWKGIKISTLPIRTILKPFGLIFKAFARLIPPPINVVLLAWDALVLSCTFWPSGNKTLINTIINPVYRHLGIQELNPDKDIFPSWDQLFINFIGGLFGSEKLYERIIDAIATCLFYIFKYTGVGPLIGILFDKLIAAFYSWYRSNSSEQSSEIFKTIVYEYHKDVITKPDGTKEEISSGNTILQSLGVARGTKYNSSAIASAEENLKNQKNIYNSNVQTAQEITNKAKPVGSLGIFINTIPMYKLFFRVSDVLYSATLPAKFINQLENSTLYNVEFLKDTIEKIVSSDKSKYLDPLDPEKGFLDQTYIDFIELSKNGYHSLKDVVEIISISRVT